MKWDILVLIHGYTLTALEAGSANYGGRSWEEVVIGNTVKDIPGRLPVGIAFSLRTNAKKLVLGSGASAILKGSPITREGWQSLGCPDEVQWEAEYTLDFLLREFQALCAFSVLRQEVEKLGGAERAKALIRNLTLSDTNSANTSDEIVNAIREANCLGLNGIVSVSSPWHEPRCIAIANREISKRKDESVKFAISLPCTTNFAQNCDTAIFEPNSGPRSDTEIDACVVLSKYFLLTKEARKDFLLVAEKIIQQKLMRSDVAKGTKVRS